MAPKPANATLLEGCECIFTVRKDQNWRRRGVEKGSCTTILCFPLTISQCHQVKYWDGNRSRRRFFRTVHTIPVGLPYLPESPQHFGASGYRSERRSPRAGFLPRRRITLTNRFGHLSGSSFIVDGRPIIKRTHIRRLQVLHDHCSRAIADEDRGRASGMKRAHYDISGRPPSPLSQNAVDHVTSMPNSDGGRATARLPKISRKIQACELAKVTRNTLGVKRLSIQLR